MIIVREVFIAKPGMASKLAKMFKEMWEKDGSTAKVMTDMTGVYNKVVIETEYADMAAWDKEMQSYMNQPKKESDASKPSHVEMYNQGKREIYRVW